MTTVSSGTFRPWLLPRTQVSRHGPPLSLKEGFLLGGSLPTAHTSFSLHSGKPLESETLQLVECHTQVKAGRWETQGHCKDGSQYWGLRQEGRRWTNWWAAGQAPDGRCLIYV